MAEQGLGALKAQIICCSESHHAAYVHCGIWTEQESGWVDEKEIGVAEPASSVRLNHSKDNRRVSGSDSTENVRGRQSSSEWIADGINRSRIEKVGDVVGRNVEVPKLWKRFVPPPGRVPPVMLWRLPFVVTTVFRPDDVMVPVEFERSG